MTAARHNTLRRRVARHARRIERRELQRLTRQVDRLFTALMAVQWLGAILLALTIAPRSWETLSTQTHLVTALGLGSAIVALPIALGVFRPGMTATRFVIATAQMLMGALLIHLTGGRIETHFHVFGSLAFLAFYRDWRVLVLASVVVAADHFVRGWLWPYSVFGVTAASPWRWVEHAAWVAFEDLFLIWLCSHSRQAIRRSARQQALLGTIHEQVDRKYRSQTIELCRAVEELRAEVADRRAAERATVEAKEAAEAARAWNATILASITEGFVVLDRQWRYCLVNTQAERLIGQPGEALLGRVIWDVFPEMVGTSFERAYREAVETGRAISIEDYYAPLDRWMGVSAYPSPEGLTLVFRDVTERRRAEAALQQAEAETRMLALVADRTDNAVVITDANGRTLWVNNGFTRITGYTLPEVAGRTPGSVLRGPGTNPAVSAFMGECVRRGEGFRTEVLNYSKEGKRYWVAIEAQPVHDERGRLVRFMAIESDITDRKRAEGRLAAQCETMRILTRSESVDEAILEVVGAIGRHLGMSVGEYWRPSGPDGRLRRVGGWGRAARSNWEFLRRSRNLAMAPDEGLIGRVWASGRPVVIQDLVASSSFGRSRLAAETGLRGGVAVPILAGLGRTIGVVALFTDEPESLDASLTQVLATLGVQIGQFLDRRRAEAEVLRINAQLNALLDASSEVAIIATDEHGTIAVFNTGAERMLGYHRAELVGQATPALFHDPEEIRAYGEALSAEFGRPIVGAAALVERARQGGRDVRQWTFVRKDGTRLPVSLAVTMVRGPSEEPLGYLSLAIDVSERVRHEAELLRAKEAAEAAACAKSEFLANMSHEIRTPMNGILGMTELALNTPLTPEQREYLELARSSAESLLTVIDDVLDFSKIEAGKLQFHPRPFGLREVCAQTLRALAVRAHDKGLELACQVAPEVPEDLLGDPDRLRQILNNLVGNAIKFTDCGEVIVTVAIDAAPNPDDAETALHFAIRDTGIGIPPDRLERIFVPFEQVDGSTTRRYGGTGLGLSIVTRLVAMMGGRVWVESEPGHGSTFHFTARFASAAPRDTQAPQDDEDRLRGLPVLVVDDNATNRQILAEVLTLWGLRPSTADSAAAALDALRTAADASRPFPLVLTDAQMPTMDGFSLIAALRDDPRLASAAILMLSSNNLAEETARCRALGVGSYLTKPIRQSELKTAILQTIAGAEAVERRDVPTRPTAPTTQAARPLRVLLAEDNPVNQRLAICLLERAGHTVTVAGDGREAVAAVAAAPSGHFDLILMDVHMPVMSGFEATAAIRALEQARGDNHHHPILALTALAMKGDRERCLEAAMDGYLSKPILREELHAAIAAAVTSPTPTTTDPEPPDEPNNAWDLDPDALMNHFLGDEALLAEMAELVRTEAPAQLEAVREAVQRGDPHALNQAAHTLKGSLTHFGPSPALDASQRLEVLGREADLSAAADELLTLEHAMKQFLAALSRLPEPTTATLA